MPTMNVLNASYKLLTDTTNKNDGGVTKMDSSNKSNDPRFLPLRRYQHPLCIMADLTQWVPQGEDTTGMAVRPPAA